MEFNSVLFNTKISSWRYKSELFEWKETSILLSCSGITITCLFICFLPDFPSAKRTFQTSLVVPLPSYHDPLYPLARYNICLPKVLRVPVSLSLEKSTFAKGAFIL